MGVIFDLHCHSTYSDGTLKPADVIARAMSNQVNVLALTDHDATTGIAEAQQAAVEAGITLINGVEISVSWHSRVLHVLGLNIDPAHPALVKGLADLRCQRLERTKNIASKLEQQGIANVLHEVTELAGTPAVTRTHFARLLIKKGVAKDMRQAFKKWLGKGQRAYASAQWVDLAQAITWINDAGGQAVLAHPARYDMKLKQLTILLHEFKQLGGVAIEVVSGRDTQVVREKMAALCQTHALMASVGSDFHEPSQYGSDLGKHLELPPNCQPIWHNWRT